MRPVTDAFLEEVATSPHTLVVETTVHDPSGEVTPLPISGGEVNLSHTSSIRGSCDLTIPGIDWIPKNPFDKLAPYGSEINIRWGVRFKDGTAETTSLGWFPVEDVGVDDQGNGLETKVSAFDRSQRLAAAAFEDTFQVPASTPFAGAILLIALEAWPDCPYQPGFASASDISIGRPITAQPGDNRWEFMQGLAKALGMVLYFDGDGILTLRPYAEAGAVATIAEGENGVLLSAGRSWSRTDAFNRVIATGESTTSNEVYRAVATDDNDFSPTKYGGPFGQVPRFYSSPDIYSNEQAQDAANAILAQELGTAYTVNFGMVPNGALEPEDTVRITRAAAGIDEDHILDSVSIGLAAGDTMTCTTRERTVT